MCWNGCECHRVFGVAGGKGNVQRSLSREKTKTGLRVFDCSTWNNAQCYCCFLSVIPYSILWMSKQQKDLHIFILATWLWHFTVKFAVIIMRDGIQGVRKPNFFLSHFLSRDELLFDSVSNTAKCSTPPKSLLLPSCNLAVCLKRRISALSSGKHSSLLR